MKIKKPLLFIVALSVFSILFNSAKAEVHFVAIDMTKIKSSKAAVYSEPPKHKVSLADYYVPILTVDDASPKEVRLSTVKPINKKAIKNET